VLADAFTARCRVRLSRDARRAWTHPAPTVKKHSTFKFAVSQHYWYQAFLDSLPIWGMVGEMEGSEEELEALELKGEKEHEIHDVYIYTLKRLSIAYNGDSIIEVNLTSDRPVPAKAGQQVTFSYEVSWQPTNKEFAQRFTRYLDYSFFEHQIHWFSIFNSFMMVIFLCGLVALILVRALNNDYARFTRGDDDDAGGLESGGGIGDESGWKQVHGDAFRPPPYLVLLSACVGTGAQMAMLSFGVVLLAIAGSLYIDRGALVTSVLVVYAFTSIVAGFVSGSVFSKYDSAASQAKSRWMRAMVLTATLFPGLVFAVASVLNVISIYYATINVVPLGTFLAIVAIYLFVSWPLTVLGTVLGRHGGPPGDYFPCRVNALPRGVPPRSWFTHPLTIIALTGVLPFGAVFIEIFFIFSSIWSHKFYYVWGFLLLVMLILVVVSVCVTVVAVYFQLNSEDWRWPWTAFFASGSTALYVFFYGLYFFLFKTNMTGFVQTVFYFAYLGLFCTALGLLCGAVGFLGAMVFVRRIFRNIKVD